MISAAAKTAKTASTIALLAVLGFGTVACSGQATPADNKGSSQSEAPEAVEEAPKPVDMTGEWKQTNSNSEDSFQTATITGETIEVLWNSPDATAIYWAGTVEVPQDGTTEFTWDSVNDTSKTENAIMASNDETKTFTYKDGEISYDVTALGTTMTVRLAKQ